MKKLWFDVSDVLLFIQTNFDITAEGINLDIDHISKILSYESLEHAVIFLCILADEYIFESNFVDGFDLEGIVENDLAVGKVGIFVVLLSVFPFYFIEIALILDSFLLQIFRVCIFQEIDLKEVDLFLKKPNWPLVQL